MTDTTQNSQIPPSEKMTQTKNPFVIKVLSLILLLFIFQGPLLGIKREIETRQYETKQYETKQDHITATESTSTELRNNRFEFYQEMDRAAAHSTTLIAIVFLVFLLFEILVKTKIHPIQYLLVGLALCLFSLLFLAFSEHLYRGRSYLLAASAVTSLVTFYSSFVLKKYLRGLVMTGLLSILYSHLYVSLYVEESSLLFTSLGLFLSLAALMYATRNIDWYSIGKNHA